MRILIVDDDALMARALSRALARAEVVVETDSTTALARVGTERAEGRAFDVVLCDQNMPRMSGAELLAQLEPQDASVRILMSGEGIAEPPRARGWGWLTKPFSARDVWELIDAAMGARCA